MRDEVSAQRAYIKNLREAIVDQEATITHKVAVNKHLQSIIREQSETIRKMKNAHDAMEKIGKLQLHGVWMVLNIVIQRKINNLYNKIILWVK